MPRHPTVQVPNIGPMDHAWDLLGEWQAEFELPETESPVHGKVTFRSWTDAELMLDPIEAAIAGIPSTVPLERASEIHLTDAGGGALQWVLHAPSTNWSLQATMWPGSLHLFVSDADDDNDVINPPPVSEMVGKLSQVKKGALDLISFAGIVGLHACSNGKGTRPMTA